MKKDGFSAGKILKIIGKILSWALFVVLLIAAVFLLYYFIATKIYAAKGSGYEPKFSIYTIASGSMEPKIMTLDAIVNVRVDSPNDIKVGDIITFVSTSLLSPGKTITHRVIAITKDENGNVCYQTKGDANDIADQACAKYQNIIGKVLFKIPQLGRLQKVLASKGGWLIFILVPALYIIGRDILRLTKLSNIKSTATKMSENDKKDPKKEKAEALRKAELKRKLLKENDHNNQVEYYKEPDIKTIDKRGNNKNSNKDNNKDNNKFRAKKEKKH